jgi:hypothetical protein
MPIIRFPISKGRYPYIQDHQYNSWSSIFGRGVDKRLAQSLDLPIFGAGYTE